jgi:hypothetical protein
MFASRRECADAWHVCILHRLIMIKKSTQQKVFEHCFETFEGQKKKNDKKTSAWFFRLDAKI